MPLTGQLRRGNSAQHGNLPIRANGAYLRRSGRLQQKELNNNLFQWSKFEDNQLQGEFIPWKHCVVGDALELIDDMSKRIELLEAIAKLEMIHTVNSVGKTG